MTLHPLNLPPCPDWCARLHSDALADAEWDDSAALLHSSHAGRMPRSAVVVAFEAVEHVFAPGLLEHQVDVWACDATFTDPGLLRSVASELSVAADWLEAQIAKGIAG